MKDPKSQKNRILWMSGLLATLFCWYQFFLVPLCDDRGRQSARLQSQNQLLLKNQELGQQIKSYQPYYENLDHYFSGGVSSENEISHMLSMVQSLAESQKVSIIELKPRSGPTTKDSQIIQLNLSVEGSWHDLARFFLTLQDRPLYFEMENFEIKPHPLKANVLQGELTLLQYRLLPPIPR